MSGRAVSSEHVTLVSRSAIFSICHLLALSPTAASFEVRGFTPCDPIRRQAFETIGKTFIAGYNAALQAEDSSDLISYVDNVRSDLRGFAAEGAAMGTAIADALPFRQARLPQLISLFESRFTYLVHVGAGWALARVPWRRHQILATLDPIHRWLALDGLGFHDCYFNHLTLLAGWRRERFGYAARCYEQGVGRALWFVCGGSVHQAQAAIRKLAPEHWIDLWSGLGLAMAYAGQSNESDFARALEFAGTERSCFAQGIAFACAARARAGHVPLHTQMAARAIGFDAHTLANLVCEMREELPESERDQPRYEIWRRSVSSAVSRRMEEHP